jgi:hypothetical protein
LSPLEESPWHKLYVGNPSYTVRDEDLQQFRYLRCHHAKVMMERDTRSKKALVSCSNGSDAEGKPRSTAHGRLLAAVVSP